ncbi:unnamed protein product, partial [Amoebophrya sp. A25]
LVDILDCALVITKEARATCDLQGPSDGNKEEELLINEEVNRLKQYLKAQLLLLDEVEDKGTPAASEKEREKDKIKMKLEEQKQKEIMDKQVHLHRGEDSKQVQGEDMSKQLHQGEEDRHSHPQEDELPVPLPFSMTQGQLRHWLEDPVYRSWILDEEGSEESPTVDFGELLMKRSKVLLQFRPFTSECKYRSLAVEKRASSLSFKIVSTALARIILEAYHNQEQKTPSPTATS